MKSQLIFILIWSGSKLCDLKGNLEVCVSGVGGDFFNLSFSYIAAERFFDVLNTVIYVLTLALGEHLDISVGQIADKAG